MAVSAAGLSTYSSAMKYLSNQPGGGCMPICKWQCETPECEQVCTPKCSPPRCEARCEMDT